MGVALVGFLVLVSGVTGAVIFTPCSTVFFLIIGMLCSRPGRPGREARGQGEAGRGRMSQFR
jgi:hypothetical protein